MKELKYAMIKLTACSAPNRPDYCKYDTNYCCFSCVYQEECTKHAVLNKLMRPCTPEIFDKEEICEYAI